VFPVSLLLFHANRFHAERDHRTHGERDVRRRMQLEAKRERERERERGRTFSVSENMRTRAISRRKARPGDSFVVHDATLRCARAKVVNFYRSDISWSSCNSCDENAVNPKIHKPGGKLKIISPRYDTRADLVA